jgi:hypothetical protein
MGGLSDYLKIKGIVDNLIENKRKRGGIEVKAKRSQ